MPITIAKEVIPYEEHLYCEKCNKEMEMQNMALLTDPVQFVYKCPECGETYTTTESYPRLVYKAKSTKETITQYVD